MEHHTTHHQQPQPSKKERSRKLLTELDDLLFEMKMFALASHVNGLEYKVDRAIKKLQEVIGDGSLKDA